METIALNSGYLIMVVRLHHLFQASTEVSLRQ